MSSGLRVLALTRYDRLGASSRVRFLQLLPYLAKLGIAADVYPLLTNQYVEALYRGERTSIRPTLRAYLNRLSVLLSHKHYDLIWLEKEALPWFPTWLESVLLNETPYVLDLDDAWYLRYGEHSSSPVRMLLGSKIERLMRRSAAVVVGNNYLSAHAKRSGAREVAVIPTAVDLQRYRDVENYREVHSSPFMVGWIGTPITVGYLSQVRGVFCELAKRRPFRLRIIGAVAPAAFAGLPVEEKPWSEETEIRAIAECDVGIMPLDDSSWARGKCAYKLLQFMAAGKPVVASPIGANNEVVRHGVNGMLANSPREWIEALDSFAEDSALRKRMGEAGHRTVELNYSIEQVVPKIASILMEAAQSCWRTDAASEASTRSAPTLRTNVPAGYRPFSRIGRNRREWPNADVAERGVSESLPSTARRR